MQRSLMQCCRPHTSFMLQGWWEAPFSSRRNIFVTMLSGGAALWVLNKSE